jgi:hypothetical protein
MVEAYAQEAYANGDWGQIGYTAPGDKKSSGSFESNEFIYTGALGTWNAKNRHKLDDCNANSAGWGLTSTVEPESSTKAGQVTISVGTGVPACKALTPSFEKLAKQG